MPTNDDPKTLLEAIQFFADEDVAFDFVVKMRWGSDGPACQHCGECNPSFVKTRRVFKCRKQRKQFSVRVGTIFEESKIGLSKWLPAMWMIANCKNGVSSYELGRALGVTQKSAWFMLHRIRLAMQDDDPDDKFGGHVEVDETFIGGKARNMHKDRKERVIKGRGPEGKIAVMGLLQRHGEDDGSKVRTRIVSNRKKTQLQGQVRMNVEPDSSVYSDELASYEGLDGRLRSSGHQSR